MYVVLDYDNTTVIGFIPPDKALESVADELNGRQVVQITLENTPAYIGGTWDGTRFYPPKETT